MIKNIAKKIFWKLKLIIGITDTKLFQKKSFSQTGEDIIVDYIFQLRNIHTPSYIDIGAFHPFLFSNTAFFYEKGSKGINVEPNPDGINLFFKNRPKDINLNIGIGQNKGTLDYFCMNAATMNTFDKDGANDLVQNHGFEIVEIKPITVETLQHVISNFAKNIFPDFLSLDVEGLDMVILEQIDYQQNFPKVICVETVEYTNDGTGEKNKKLIDFLIANGYFIYADTNINTIFVNNNFWNRKLKNIK